MKPRIYITKTFEITRRIIDYLITFILKKVYRYTKFRHENAQIASLGKNMFSLKYIDRPTFLTQLVSVKKFGPSIQYIKNPCEQIQLEAVKENPIAVRYIKNPSLAVQYYVVRKHPHFIKWIKNPEEKIQLEAVQNSPTSLVYIYKPSIDTVQYAVKQDGILIRIIPEKYLDEGILLESFNTEWNTGHYEYVMSLGEKSDWFHRELNRMKLQRGAFYE